MILRSPITLHYRKIIAILILFTAFAMRFYRADTIPYNWDEMTNVRAARGISFDFHHLKLPLINTKPEGILSEMYAVRLGWNIFGESYLGARLPSIIIGLLIILLVYFFVQSTFGIESALMACLFLALSPFCIVNTRNADLGFAIAAFSFLSLSIFYKGIITSNKKLILLTGVIIGLGFLIKESMIFMIPIYIIFLWISPKYRFWLKNKYLWISFAIAIFMILPFVWLDLEPQAQRFRFIYNEVAIGPSLNAVGLYIGELILLAAKYFSHPFFNYIAGSVDPEYPPVNFILGLLILIAVFKYIKDKRPFVRLLVITFFFNFVLFSFLRGRDNIVKSAWSLASLEWGIIGFIPGLVLVSDMLANFFSRNNYYRKVLFVMLVIFMFIRGWKVASFPLSCYPPIRDRCIEQLLYDDARGNMHDYLGKPVYGEVHYYLKEGEVELSEDILKNIYKTADNKPEYKKRAALELIKIFIKEGRYKQAKKYLSYAISHDPRDAETLKLLKEIERNKISKQGLSLEGYK